MVDRLYPQYEGDDSVLGSAEITPLVQYHNWAYADWAEDEGMEILGTPLVRERTDRIFLRITNHDASGVDRLEIPLGWFQLPVKEASDPLTLGTDAVNVEVIDPDDSGPFVHLIAGRTAHNRVLLARTNIAANPPENVQASIDVESNSGGLLGRRIDALRSHSTKTVTLHIHSAAEPADPVGVSVTTDAISVGSDGYQEINTPLPASDDPEWIAQTFATYDTSTGLYTLGSWTKWEKSTFRGPLFAATADGPFQATDPGAPELFMQTREANGNLVVTQLRDVGSPWDTLHIFNFTSSQVNVITLDRGGGGIIRIHDVYSFIVIKWDIANPNFPDESVTIPSIQVTSGNRGANGAVNQSINVELGPLGSHFSIGKGVDLEASDADTVRARIDFGAPNSGSIGTQAYRYCKATLGAGHVAGHLVIYGLRR